MTKIIPAQPDYYLHQALVGRDKDGVPMIWAFKSAVVAWDMEPMGETFVANPIALRNDDGADNFLAKALADPNGLTEDRTFTGAIYDSPEEWLEGLKRKTSPERLEEITTASGLVADKPDAD